MVPLSTLIDVENILGPVILKRHNMFRSATVTAVPAAGLSTGDAIRVMQEEVATALPPGYSFEWTGTAQQQLSSSGLVVVILGMAVLFTYLFLVAQYESWTMPVAILLSVVVAMFGAVLAVAITGSDINLYTQIGMIMLIGMAAKNGILIVEFAMERRAAGLSIKEAAHEAGRQRFRAVMMTAFLMRFSSWRTLPGQGASMRRAVASAERRGGLTLTVSRLIWAEALAMKCWARAGISSARSLKAGSSSTRTLRR